MKPDAAFAATQNSEASLVHWAGTTRKIEKVQSGNELSLPTSEKIN